MEEEDEEESDREYQEDAEGPQLKSGSRARMARILQASGATSRDSDETTSSASSTRESEPSDSKPSQSADSKPRKKLPPGAWLFRRPGK